MANGNLGLPFLHEGDNLTFSIAYGQGMGSTINDSPPDAFYDTTNNSLEVVPVWGYYLAYEHKWTKTLSSVILYGALKVDNPRQSTLRLISLSPVFLREPDLAAHQQMALRRRAALGRAVRTRTEPAATTPACSSPPNSLSKPGRGLRPHLAILPEQEQGRAPSLKK